MKTRKRKTSGSSSENLADPDRIRHTFWRYTLPAILGMLVSSIYSTADGIFLGQAVGAEGLAAINMVWPVFSLFIGLGLMCGLGAGTLASIARGQSKPEQARQILGNTIPLLMLLSLVSGILLFAFRAPLMSWLGASGNVLSMADDYLLYISLAAPVGLFGAAVPLLVRNDQNPRLATIIMIAGAVINIVFDYLFIMVLDMQVAGTAIATIIAEGIVMLWGLGYFFSRAANMQLDLSSMKLQFRLSINTLATGASGFFMFMYFGFIMAVHNLVFMKYSGMVAVGAYAIVGYIQAIYYMVAEGVSTGIQPLLSYNKGAGNHNNVRKVFAMAMQVVMVSGLVTILLVNVYPEQITAIFNNSDHELSAHTVTGLRLHLAAIFLDGFIFVSAAYFQALARSSLATTITIANMLVQIPLVLLLPIWFGVTGIWIAVPVSNIFLSIIVLALLIADFRQQKQQTDRALLEERTEITPSRS
ncbi:MATE family efflux transporter [Endozoicomonadaceae bacterium StTr2]